MPDLLQTLKGNEIWLSQAKQWAPPAMHRYFDEQIVHAKAMYDAVLRLGIDSVKADTKTLFPEKDKLISNLQAAYRDVDKESTSCYCLGCGRERDEDHKADCLIYPGKKV